METETPAREKNWRSFFMPFLRKHLPLDLDSPPHWPESVSIAPPRSLVKALSNESTLKFADRAFLGGSLGLTTD